MEGKVINIGSGEPIDSVLVILYGGNPLSNPLMPGFNDNPPSGNNDTAYTNDVGEFSLIVKNESAAFLGWLKEGYENGEIFWYLDDFKTKSSGSGNKFFSPGTKKIIIEYEAECSFLPVFQKSGINTSKDSLIVSIASFRCPDGFVSYRSYFGKSPFKLDSDLGYCTGDAFFHFKLDFTDNGIWKSIIDSIFVDSFKTYSDTIYY